MTKSPIELIQQLIDDMIEGNTSQEKLLIALVNANVPQTEKTELESRIKHFVEYAENGTKDENSNAIYLYGLMNLNGIGLPQNPHQAKELFEQASIFNNPNAIRSLATMYQIGKGVDQNYPKAIELYEKAITLNNASAMNALAVMYHEGTGIAQNISKAIELFEQAIKLGNATAMNNRAIMHERVPQSIPQAIKLFQQAIQLSHHSAMCNLAVMYQKGENIPQDIPKAIELFKLAIKLGHVAAMTKLALIYKDSLDNSIRDHSKAARLFRQAAGKNCTESQDHLKNGTETTYQYHYNMLNHQIENAVQLVVTHRNLVSEFIECDFILALSSPKTLKSINEIIKTVLDQNKETEVCQNVILALLKAYGDWATSNPQPLTQEQAIFQSNCLNALNIDKLNKDEILLISHQIINLWYLVDGFTDDATNYLSNLFFKAQITSISFDSFCLRNMAIIFVKKLYGDQYKISDEWTKEQVMFLISFIKCASKPKLERINECLGAELIVLDKPSPGLAVTDLGFFEKRADFDAAEQPPQKKSCCAL